MNTGVQRSSATPPGARTATTLALGPQPGADFGKGKNLPRIAMAHEIPYVATATVADLHDLEAKVEHAMTLHGARYLHILVPCPLGWGSASHDTIRLARLARETGIFPVFEAEHGEVTRVTKIRHRLPVEEYLRPQRRFAHLFGPKGTEVRIRPTPTRTSAATGSDKRPPHDDAKPFAITGPARRWPARPARGAPSGRSTSTACPLQRSARRAKTSRVAVPRRAAITKPRGAT
jgi:hypothetical protein